MNAWANAVITDKGLALQSKLTQGNSLNITRAVTGSGYVAAGLLTKQVAVSSPKQTLKFLPMKNYPEVGKCAIPVELTNNEVQAGYTALQVGVFAEDPDEGEILYFIAQAADESSGTIIPSATEMPGYSAEWTFYFQYGQADTVNVTVDPANTINRTQAQKMIDESLVDYNLKTYTSLAQIGLRAGSETIESIVESLPEYSTLFMNVGADNADIYPVAYGALYVMKRDNTRAFFEFLEKTSARRYFGVYDSTMSTTWSGWEKFSTAADLDSHLNDKENPHAVTKKQVGLGNVPNVATNDQTPTYSDTTTLATLKSGEKLNVAFQKIKCAITNLISHMGSHKLQTFISFADIGLTIGSETIEDIATKLPESSQLFVVVGADGADIYPTTYGTLHVLKKNTSRTYFEFLEKTNTRRYYGTYDSSMSKPWSGWGKSYSAHDKPTPADIGAVNKDGDIMTGELKLQDLADPSQCSRVYSSEGLGLGFITDAGNTYSARTMLKINKPDVDKSNLLRLAHATEAGDSRWYNIYGEHNKPSPSEIGALNLNPITDDEYLISEGDNLNNYTTPGAFRCSSATVAGTLGNMPAYKSAGFRLIVSAISTASGTLSQVAIFNTVNFQIYVRIYSSDGKWSGWKNLVPASDGDYADCNYIYTPDGNKEWLNPRLSVGYEYRTTKRWNGKAVYKKIVDLGNLPSKGEKQVEHGIDVNTLSEFVSIQCIAQGYETGTNGAFGTGTAYQIGHAYSTNEATDLKESVNIFLGKYIRIEMETDASAYHGYAVLEYTKIS